MIALDVDGVLTDGRIIYRQSAGGVVVMCAYRVSYSAPWN